MDKVSIIWMLEFAGYIIIIDSIARTPQNVYLYLVESSCWYSSLLNIIILVRYVKYCILDLCYCQRLTYCLKLKRYQYLNNNVHCLG